MNITELTAKLGITIDRNKWDSARKSIKDVKNDFKSLRLGFLAAGVGLVYFEEKLGTMAGKLKNQSQILQVPTKQLQALKLAASEAMVPFNAVSGAVGGLQAALEGLRSGAGLPGNLQRGLGMLSNASHEIINPSTLKTGYALFSKISQALSKVKGTQRKEGILNTLFGNSELLPMIGHGMGGINKAYGEMKSRHLFYSDKQLNQAKAFANQMSIIRLEFSKMAVTLGVQLLPMFKALSSDFLKIGKNKNFISSMIAIGKAVGIVAVGVAKIIILLNDAANAFAYLFGKFALAGEIVTGKYTPAVLTNDASARMKNPIVKGQISKMNSTSNVVNHNINITNNGNYGFGFTTSHITGGNR